MKTMFVALVSLAVVVGAGETKMPNLDKKIQEMREYNQKTLDWMKEAESFDPKRWEKIEKETYQRKYESLGVEKIEDKGKRESKRLLAESIAFCQVKDRFLKEKGWGLENSSKKEELKKYWDYISQKCFSAEKKSKNFRY